MMKIEKHYCLLLTFFIIFGCFCGDGPDDKYDHIPVNINGQNNSETENASNNSNNGTEISFTDNNTYPGYLSDELARPYRTGSIDKHIINVPSGIQSGVFNEPGIFLDDLVGYLVQNTSNDFKKVKRIHDWIIENIYYDMDSFLKGDPPEQSVYQVLGDKKTLCEGYSKLFKKMAYIAGIDSKIVAGLSKGYGFSNNGGLLGHAWNAVNIKDRWQRLPGIFCN